MLERSLKLPAPDSGETFFLWGPRQSGKSTLLKKTYSAADSRIAWIDLLKATEFRRYTANPEYLRTELLAARNAPKFVVIDEVQKVPPLLDEVHWLIENQGVAFALCGSSARKIKRGKANLLGGRAIRYELFGLTGEELIRNASFDLTQLLNRGYFPKIYFSGKPDAFLDAYVSEYLKEEIFQESLVRNLPVFSRFLEAAALSDADAVNFTNIASDCGVSSETVSNYFQILEDTLLGSWLPAYVKRPKRKIKRAPKFYFCDVGVVNHLAKRHQLKPGSDLFGKAFENWVHHELRAFIKYREIFQELSYWGLAGQTEVDFVIGDMLAAIEVKASATISSRHLKGIRKLMIEHPEIPKNKCMIVCLEEKRRVTEDGIQIIPYQNFIRELWDGEIF